MPTHHFALRAAVVAAAALVLLALGTRSASAQQLPTGAFLVSMPLPGATPNGATPDCTPALESVALVGGTARCTLNRKITADTATGTVSNATLADQYGSGFANGTMRRSCDMDQKMTMNVTFAAGAITSGGRPTMAMSGEMVMLCTWSMAFSDERQSGLEGTMELNARLSSSDVTATGPTGADIEMQFKVYATRGTGLFDGFIGSGELTQEQALSLLGGAGSGAGGGAGGGAAPGGTPPSGSDSILPDAVCAQLGLAAGCTAASAAALCSGASRPAACDYFSFSSAPRRTLRQAGDTMTLKLVKKAGAVRILSPLAKPGTKQAVIKATTRVRLVATAGAVCTVKASTGKVVGTVTSRSSSKVVSVRAKAGSYQGAKWLQASCLLDSKRFTSPKVRVSLK